MSEILVLAKVLLFLPKNLKIKALKMTKKEQDIKKDQEEPRDNKDNNQSTESTTNQSEEQQVSDKQDEPDKEQDADKQDQQQPGEKQEKEKEQKKEPADKKDKQDKKSGKDTGKKADKKQDKDKRIDELGKQLKEMQDKYLRLSAEFDNYRKRTLKEKMELTKSAGENILQDILPVMDNFERAQQSVHEAKDLDAVREGIDLIYNRFKEFLEQNGIKEIDAMDQPFDTEYHEAVTKIPAPDEDKKGKVVDVIQKGYYLNDKVLRYAKVVVGE